MGVGVSIVACVVIIGVGTYISGVGVIVGVVVVSVLVHPDRTTPIIISIKNKIIFIIIYRSLKYIYFSFRKV